MRANDYVGRVGALAVALGVGSAIVGFAAVAGADTGAGSGVAADGSTPSAASGPAAGKVRAGSRQGAPTGGALGSPAAAAAAVADNGGRTGTPERRPGGRRSAPVGKRGQAGGGAPPIGISSPVSVAPDAGATPVPAVHDEVAVTMAPDGVAAEPALSPQVAAMAVAQEAPAMTAAAEFGTISEADATALDGLGGGGGTDTPIAEPLAWASLAFTRRELSGLAPEVAPAATLADSAPVDPAVALAPVDPAVTPTPVDPVVAETPVDPVVVSPPDVVAPATFTNPPLPSGSCRSITVCGSLGTERGMIQNQIAAEIVKVLPTAGPAGGCSGSTCTVSPANYIASYAFNVIYSLMGGLPTATVATAVQQLATQPQILAFISQTVAGSKALANVPPDVATTVGNAVASFVQNSFGNINVATQFVPFLQALNLPTTGTLVTGPYSAFLAKITSSGVTAAILSSGNGANARSISQPGMQSALISFFSNTSDQTTFGTAFAGSINMLLGSTAVADYLGQLGADAVLGADSPSNAALSTTISGALSQLFSSIGGAVAADAGNALVTLLNQPASGANLSTANYLANYMVNGLVTFLGGTPQFAPVALLPSLAPAAGVAVSQFVGDLFVIPAVPAAMDTFVTEVVTGMLGNVGVQDDLDQWVTGQVSALLGGGEFGDLVGAQVGGAVVGLVNNPVISDALAGLVDSVFTDFFSSYGVVSALAGAAGQLATADLNGTLSSVKPVVEAELRASPAIQAGVGTAVGDAVTAVLGDQAVWSLVDAAAASVVTSLLGDPTIQDALNARVADEVSTLLGGGQLGQVVGAQVGDAVVGLLANPLISGPLLDLVDSTFTDFFGAPGVVAAFANAADELAITVVSGGDLAQAEKAATAELRANPDVQAGAGIAVGDGVTALLSDHSVWSLVDSTAASLVTSLLGDTVVQDALNARVAAEVSTLLGGGAVAQTVGAQVGASVVGLLANPVVSNALVGLVDSVAADFFGAPGVVSAFSNAADYLTVAVVSGVGLSEALAETKAQLLANTAVQAAERSTITSALTLVQTTVLTDPAIQQALGAMVKTLFTGLASSPDIQSYVEGKLGPLLRDVVTNLLGNPTVSDEAAAALGTAVTQFLSYPGFGAALTGAMGVFAEAALGGTPMSLALQEAVTALQSAPAFVAAVNAIVPPDVDTVLGYADVRDAIGTAAKEETIAALEGAGIDNKFLDGVAGQFAKGTVEALLEKPAAINLIDTLAVNLILGMPLGDVTEFVTQEVLDEPTLQIALGMSIGAGIGSLFGDNIVGDVIGVAAGLPITLAIGIAAGLVQIYQWLIGKQNEQWTPAAQAASSESHYFQVVPAAADLYVTNTITLDWQAVAAG